MNIYLRKIINSFMPSVVILLYHRVANVENDPLLLSVSPQNFLKQIEFVKDNFQVKPLSTVMTNFPKKKTGKKTAVLTFDDGYQDNLTQALPILKKFNLPATIFITAQKVGSKGSFSWDKDQKRKGRGKPLTLPELKKLATSPLIEIGSHTLTHPHLSKISLKEQEREIVESRKLLEAMIGKKIKTFSYPFGRENDFNLESERIVREAGYLGACTAIPGLVYSFVNQFLWPRIIVRNWDIGDFTKYLEKWA